MKTTQHARTPLLLLLAFTGIASAQLKTGSNPTSIAATSNFEVEATNGNKTVIEKATGNLGIGTTTPASTLSVNGSFATNYTSVTANAYTLAAADSIVAWSGSAAGTLTLPAAVSGTGNFKGRTYTVKNTSGSYEVTVTAPGSEKIDANSTYAISPGASATFVSTGATSGATWTSVSQSSTAGTSFSGGFVSGVDLTGLPTATINVTLVNDGMVTVTSSQMTNAMNSLPGNVAVIVVKPTNSASYTNLSSGQSYLTIVTPTNTLGRTLYILLDFSSVEILASGGAHDVAISFSSKSWNYDKVDQPVNFKIFTGRAREYPIKHSEVYMLRGTSSDYWIWDQVGVIAY